MKDAREPDICGGKKRPNEVQGEQHVEPGSVEDTCATEFRDGEQRFYEVQSGKCVEHGSRSDALASEDCDGEQRLRQGDPHVEHGSIQDARATKLKGGIPSAPSHPSCAPRDALWLGGSR